MKVKFIRQVVTPEHRAGEPGEVKELPDFDARELIKYGYCECLDELAGGTTKSNTEGGEAADPVL